MSDTRKKASPAKRLSTRAKRADTYHHGDLAAALVAAGRGILEAEGHDALSLRGVARAAGVSQAAPYHHFADKEALLAAIATQGFRELAQEMGRGAGQDDHERMLGLGAGYVVFAWKNPALFRLMHGPYFRDATKYEGLLVAAAESFDMLRDGVRGCLPGSSEDEVEEVCLAAWAIVHGAAMLLVDGRVAAGETEAEVDAWARRIAGQLRLGD